MSDDSLNKRIYNRLQAELRELDDPRVQYQQVLDRLWWTKRQAEVEEARIRKSIDPFDYGHWR